MSDLVTQVTGTLIDIPDDPPATRFAALRGGLVGSARGRIGLGLLGFVIVVALIGPLVAPHALSVFVGSPNSGPSKSAWLGTDYLGRDVFSRTLNGGLTVIWMSFASTALGVFVGAVIGMTAAYRGGFIGSLIMRGVDLLFAFPYMVLILLFLSMVGSSTWLLVVLVAVGWISIVARLAYGITLSIVSLEYVQSAEVIGLPKRHIVFREILPNLLTPLLVQFGQYLAWSVGVISGLSFLGFGVQPPASDWGLMVNENRGGLYLQPWGVLAPVIMIAIFTIGANFITEGYSRWRSGTEEGAAQ
jgi:peptide/nickel transport system permease protein